MITVLALSLLAADANLPAAKIATADKDPMICRNEAATGTRFTKRICLRKSEIEARSQADERAMKERVDAPQPQGTTG